MPKNLPNAKRPATEKTETKATTTARTTENDTICQSVNAFGAVDSWLGTEAEVSTVAGWSIIGCANVVATLRIFQSWRKVQTPNSVRTQVHTLRGPVTLTGMIKIGRFEIRSVSNGTIRLDGGSMFGVVPKVMWSKVTDVDDSNRILLHTRTLIAVDLDKPQVILVDTGCGTKWTPEQAERFAITSDADAIPNALASWGLSDEDVTDIIVTHLHFDHNGGLTDWFDDPDGPTVVRYPKAKHWIHRQHWEHANNPHVKDRASFLEQDFAALADAGVLQFVDGETPEPPFDGVEWVVSTGHTPYQLHPLFTGADGRLLFVGDIIPTVAHLRLGWVMAYDMEPLQTIAQKKQIFERAFEEDVWLAFPHDPKVGGVVIDGTIERPIVAHTLDL